MSSVYQPKRKEMARVIVVSTDEYSKNRKFLRYVGSVNRGFTNFITTRRNRKTGSAGFIDDTSSLPKRAKNDVVKFFTKYSNRNRGVAYLVVPNEKKNIKGGK